MAPRFPEVAYLKHFVTESNFIEGIHRKPTKAELFVHKVFVNLDTVTVEDMKNFVNTIQPGAVLRNAPGLDVYVGSHNPPPGGTDILLDLVNILCRAAAGEDAHQVHKDYETLHPFTDGNGRSGRALWLWCHKQRPRRQLEPYPNVLRRGFLHSWYYHSLEHDDRRRANKIVTQEKRTG